MAQCEKLTCFVLMPFHPAFSFVYEFGIKEALNDICETHEHRFVIQVHRADERLAIKTNKVQEIRTTPR